MASLKVRTAFGYQTAVLGLNFRDLESDLDLPATDEPSEDVAGLSLEIGGEKGRRCTAIETDGCKAGLRQLRGVNRANLACAVIATHLAEVLYEANELEACEALVNDYLPIVVETGLPDHLIVLHRIAARLHFHRGRFDAGQGILTQLHEIGAQRGIRRLSAAAWLERTYAALRTNDFDAARRSLARGSDATVWRCFGDFKLHASDIEDPLIAELRL